MDNQRDWEHPSSNSSSTVDELFAKISARPQERDGGVRYSQSLRAFALTLNFYSPKAYEYVRKTFCNCLPHAKTLQKWYQNVSGEPGFSQEVCEALKRYSAAEGKHIPCA